MAYDVFLSHCSSDKRAVRELARALQGRGLEVFLDEDELKPGQPWLEQIEKALEISKAQLVVVGSEGLEGWVSEEARSAISLATKMNVPVIPVLIAGALELPAFLSVFTAVDLRAGLTEEGLDRLEWGITGQKPARRLEKATAVPFTVPCHRNPYFTGRADILEALRAKFTENGVVAIGQTGAISGLGGIGKTQAAVEYAFRYRGDYPNGVFFVRAATRDDLLSDFAKLAEAVGVDGHDQEALATAARRWLEENAGWLLIVDGADEPAITKPFLPRDHRGHVLVTSRASALDELKIRKPFQMGVLPANEALELLLSRAERDDDASTAERQAAAELSEDLGHLPLVLELAGAYVRESGVAFADYLAAWKKRGLDLLEKTKEGPVSLAATWSMNFEAIEETSPASADLLRMSAFLAPDEIPDEVLTVGGIELGDALAEALGNADPLAVGELLSPLLDHSLVKRDAEARTWSVHRLVQAFVRLSVGEAKGVWLTRLVKALARAFPWPEYSTFGQCERLVAHIVVVAQEAEDTLDLAGLLNSTASYLGDRARYSEAEPLYHRSLAIRELVLGYKHPDIAGSLDNLATLYTDQGRFAEAETLYMRSLAILDEALGEEHPNAARTLNNLAELFRAQGRYHEAEPLIERALSIREKVLGEEHPDVATTLNNLALLNRNLGRPAEAKPLLERALAIWEKGLGEEHPVVATALNNLANLYFNQGGYAESEPLIARALAIRERALGEEHPDVATALNNLAAVYVLQDRKAEAKPLFIRALAIREKVFGGEHPTVAESVRNLAVLQEPAGQESPHELLPSVSFDGTIDWSSTFDSTLQPHKKLLVHRMSLENIRCFERFDLEFVCAGGYPPQLTMVLGENAAGKSTLLRSLVLGLARESDASALIKQLPGSFVRKGAGEGVIRLGLSDGEKKLALTTRIFVSGANETVRKETEPDPFPWQDLFVCAYGTNRSREATASYETYTLYQAVLTLFNDSALLQNPEVVLLRQQEPRKRAELERRLMRVLMLDEADYEVTYPRTGPEIHGPWGDQPVRTLSDGYRSTAQWVVDYLGWAIHAGRLSGIGEIGGILIIDEIEQHLHPRWQRYIVQLLCNQFRNTQIFASTHTPLAAAGVADVDGSILVRLNVANGKVDKDVIDPSSLGGKRADQVLSDVFGLITSRNPGSLDDFARYAELIGKAERTPEEEAETERLAESLEVSLRVGESQLEREVASAVNEILTNRIRSVKPELLDLEVRRQLRDLFRGG